MRVGQELGLEEAELQNLEVAALLHDIGKVGIPDAILRKPERLDPEEYALMKRHSEYGWAVLRMLPGFERAALDILHHHESSMARDIRRGSRTRNTGSLPHRLRNRRIRRHGFFPPLSQGLAYEEAVRRLSEASGTSLTPSSSGLSSPSRRRKCPRYSPPPALGFLSLVGT